MLDIKMCNFAKCPLSPDCYRYRAIPNQWQSYFSEMPYNFTLNECEYFAGIINGDKLQDNIEKE